PAADRAARGRGAPLPPRGGVPAPGRRWPPTSRSPGRRSASVLQPVVSHARRGGAAAVLQPRISRSWQQTSSSSCCHPRKKQHTLKNTVMALPDKFILFLGRTFSGHNHDSLMLKQEFPPELAWLSDLYVRVDLGYLGIKSDDRGAQIAIPTRKPRK